MKSTLNKIARFSLLIAIPAMVTMGCQEDVEHPQAIKKGKIKKSPGE